MFKFLWNCKPDKIKRDLIIQDYNDGGLNIIDNSRLYKALKASWVRRILKRDSKLSQIYKTGLKQYGEFTNTIRWKKHYFKIHVIELCCCFCHKNVVRMWDNIGASALFRGEG